MPATTAVEHADVRTYNEAPRDWPLMSSLGESDRDAVATIPHQQRTGVWLISNRSRAAGFGLPMCPLPISSVPGTSLRPDVSSRSEEVAETAKCRLARLQQTLPRGEIISTERPNDRTRSGIFTRAGVPEYWIVDCDARRRALDPNGYTRGMRPHCVLQKRTWP